MSRSVQNTSICLVHEMLSWLLMNSLIFWEIHSFTDIAHVCAVTSSQLV